VSFDGVASRPDGAQAAAPIFSRFDNRFPGIVFSSVAAQPKA